MRFSPPISSLLPLIFLTVFSAHCCSQTEADPFATTFTSPASSSDDALAKENRALKARLADIRNENEKLKQRANALEKSMAQVEEDSKNSISVSNSLHKKLFETLIFSDDQKFQEMALKHLVAYVDEVQKLRIEPALHSVDVHRRLRELTDSDSETIRQIASAAFFHIYPAHAMEIGIQFGTHWKPVEHINTDIDTRRIFDALSRPSDAMYEETPLWEVLDDFKQVYNINIKMGAGIDRETMVTFESTGRTLLNTLADLLEKVELGLMVEAQQIVVLKNTSPKLRIVGTYNVASLNSLGKTSTPNIIKHLESAFGEDIEFSQVNETTFTAKTDLQRQVQVQQKIATLIPTLKKWSSR